MNMFIDNPNPVTFEVERETRTIRGLALPYGDVAESKGQKWTFAKGTLTWGRTKVLINHDMHQAVGVADFEDTDAGLVAVLKIARGAEGDRTLTLAEDGVYDGLSVGIGQDVKFARQNGVNVVASASVPEVSVTPFPSFDKARVTSVAASAALNQEESMSTTTEETTEVVAFSATEGKELADKIAGVEKQIKELAELKAPAGAGGAQFTVTEEPIYRFGGNEGAPSGHDFATDLLAAANGDLAALDRLQKFTANPVGAPSFIATTDVNEANQPRYRPDMFVGQAPTPTSPMFDTFKVGTLSDVTPFFWTKLDRTNTTVAVHDHTEGTDPSDDNLVTATGATVTPTAISGKVHINREVADQGGNPAVSALVWAEFERSKKIALETKTVALVNASAGSIAALTTIAAGADGEVAGNAIEAGLIDLQFIADGGRFAKGFAHKDLYKVLALVENDNGEKRYPIINPQNRSGIAGSKFAFLEIAGYRFDPIHSLGASSGSASNSYVADPTAVHVWDSPLQRLEKLQETVAGWDLGVFGYFAGVVYDVTGLRKIAYDPTA